MLRDINDMASSGCVASHSRYERYNDRLLQFWTVPRCEGETTFILLNAHLAVLLKPSFHTLCGTPIRGKLQAKGMHPNAQVVPI